jgi:hypothetical protein
MKKYTIYFDSKTTKIEDVKVKLTFKKIKKLLIKLKNK